MLHFAVNFFDRKDFDANVTCTNVVNITIFTIHEKLDCDGNLQLVGMDCIGPDDHNNKLFDYHTFELMVYAPHPHNENF